MENKHTNAAGNATSHAQHPSGNGNDPSDRKENRISFIRRHFEALTNIMVILLSAGLIVWISFDTFRHGNILENHGYMTYQFWVCIFFMLDFFIGLRKAEKKSRYFWTQIWMFLLSIPYLNIVNFFDLHLHEQLVNFLRFIPLARGGLAVFIVMRYINSNAISSLFLAYIVIMVFSCYFCSLVFYQAEYLANPMVKSYWSSLWWSAMNLTTVGCNIEPVTTVGKIVAVFLPVIGMVIFPLFTVYLTNLVTTAVTKAKSAPAPQS